MALLVGLLFGCTNAAHEDNPLPLETAFPEQCPTTACVAGPTVTAAGELAALIASRSEWVGFGPYTTGCLPASADIRVVGAVTVQGDSVAVPASCAAQSDCRKEVRFRLISRPPGVDCLEPEQWYGYTLCAGVALRDTTVRVRTVQQDIHPSALGNFAPVVDVLSACDTPCSDAALTCEATHTCWSSARDHCAYCLGGSNAACACWDGEQLDADGARCTISLSGDNIARGTCHAGSCDLDP